MRTLMFKAHFDGKCVTLDEPCDLRPGTPVIVAVIPTRAGLEGAEWKHAAAAGLARAYADDEPEYSPADIDS